ncbi:CheR family methyltransferase, partial [Paenibacillus sp. GbtcB18]|uniref:CheR family methyltransferase n=1 Tax=Paenibacillus sp. GbtcB18 TaxID=2824763 RepID=UPI002674057B
LRDNIVFAQHNLVTDRTFNEFHVILCRNVLFYFNTQLQNQVHTLIYESLGPSGFLILGDKETITFTKRATAYEAVSTADKIYRKVQ